MSNDTRKSWFLLRGHYKQRDSEKFSELASDFIANVLTDILEERLKAKSTDDLIKVNKLLRKKFNFKLNPDQKLSLNSLLKVFMELDLLAEQAPGPVLSSLICTFNPEKLFELIVHLKNPQFLTTNKTKRLIMLQILQFTTILLFIKDEIDLNENEFIDSEIIGEKVKLEHSDDFDEDKRLINTCENHSHSSKIGKNRKIVLNADIIQRLLSKTYNELSTKCPKNDPKSFKTARSRARRIIYLSGFDAGSRNGKCLFEQMLLPTYNVELTEKISQWCEFDSDLGFGKFVNQTEITKGKISGQIVVINNFLVHNKLFSDENNICSFMRGYIKGVLGNIIKSRIDVMHRKKECAQYNLDSNACIFPLKTDEKLWEKSRNLIGDMNLEEEL